MKLHWSPRSPYVRKVMIVAHETGLVDRIACVRSVALRSEVNPDIIKDSPVGRIPTLVLDDGVVLSGSYPICDYLDSLHEGPRMIPQEASRKWRELELYGIADGLLDTLIVWRGEFIRPANTEWEALSSTCAAKTEACLNWLEKRAAAFATQDYGIGLVTAGVALDYLDFRCSHLSWRPQRPNLTRWHESYYLQRPSTKATEIVNDERQ